MPMQGADRAYIANKYGLPLANVAGAGGKRLTLGTMGESLGQAVYLGQAIHQALYRSSINGGYYADIAYDVRTYANGGTDFAIGGTTTNGTNGLLTQMGWMQSRPCDIIIIASGYNDQAASSALAVSVVATNVITVANAAFAAGSKYVIIMGIGPRNTIDQGSWMTYNHYMRLWCEQTPGAYFVDSTAALVGHNSTYPIYRSSELGVTNAAYLSMTDDGTHPNGYGASLVAPLLADVFKKIAPQRKPRTSFLAGNYDPANKPYINMLGDAGMMQGTVGILNSGSGGGNVAGVSTASRVSVSVQGTGNTSTPSIYTGAADKYTRQRVTLGGSSLSSAYIQTTITPTIATPNNGNASRTYQLECMIDLTGVSGIADIWLQPSSYNTWLPLKSHAGGFGAATGFLDNTTETLFLYSTYDMPVPSAANPVFGVMVDLINGYTPTGTIDLYRMSAYLTSAP